MAKKKKQEPTEAEKAEEARAENVRATLESSFIRNVIGSNSVKVDPMAYGNLGLMGADEAYGEVTASQEFGDVRKDYMARERDKLRNSGIFGETALPTNGDVSYLIATQAREVYGLAKVGELEEHSKSIGAGLDFEVPEELREHIGQELSRKAVDDQGKFNPDQLNDKEQAALELHQMLTQAYERACAVSTAMPGYFGEFNAGVAQILRKYEESKEPEESS